MAAKQRALVVPGLAAAVVLVLAASITAAAVRGGSGPEATVAAPGTTSPPSRSVTMPAASSAPPVTPSPAPPSSVTVPPPEATGSPTGIATPTPTPSPTEDDSDPLARTLVDPPPPYERVADANSGTGPLDLEAAAIVDGGGALSEVGLRRLGFEEGYSRQWASGEMVLVALVYSFDSEEGAQVYVEQAAQARTDGENFQRAPAPDIDDAVAFRSVGQPNTARVAIFPVDNRAFVLGLVGPGEGPSQGSLELLAEAQEAAALDN